MNDVPQFTEEEVRVMLEAARTRGDLGFRAEPEVRNACSVMDLDELVEIACAHWKRERNLSRDAPDEEVREIYNTKNRAYLTDVIVAAWKRKQPGSH